MVRKTAWCKPEFPRVSRQIVAPDLTEGKPKRMTARPEPLPVRHAFGKTVCVMTSPSPSVGIPLPADDTWCGTISTLCPLRQNFRTRSNATGSVDEIRSCTIRFACHGAGDTKANASSAYGPGVMRV